VAGDADVVGDGELLEEADVLEGAGQASCSDLARAQTADHLACEGDLAGGGAVDPGEDVEGGGLAGAVGTDEAHELTGRDGQLEIREGLEAAEADGDVARMEHGGQGATPGLVVERRER